VVAGAVVVAVVVVVVVLVDPPLSPPPQPTARTIATAPPNSAIPVPAPDFMNPSFAPSGITRHRWVETGVC
jgi:hypothetical protein